MLFHPASTTRVIALRPHDSGHAQRVIQLGDRHDPSDQVQAAGDQDVPLAQSSGDLDGLLDRALGVDFGRVERRVEADPSFAQGVLSRQCREVVRVDRF